jgi:hypothetical protein
VNNFLKWKRLFNKLKDKMDPKPIDYSTAILD